MEPKDYRHEESGALYEEAQVFAQGYGAAKHPYAPTQLHWAAWFAARRASDALLNEARDMGLSAEQVERLRRVAAHVAAD
jgi:hypothetical protein